MRCSPIAAIFAAALLTCSIAFAEEPGADEVSLKNGGTIRGTVVSSEPGTSVKIIELGQKDTRTIPWSEVSDVERGKFAPKQAPQPGPTGPGYAPAAPISIPVPEAKLGEAGVVRLHVDSPKPVQIFQHSAPQYTQFGAYSFVVDNAKLVCESPCDKVLDGRQGQRFSATGDFPGSTSFTTTSLKDDVELKVRPGSSGMRALGTIATSLGGAAVAAGAVMLALSNMDGAAGFGGNDMTTPSVGLLVGGGVALVGGIVLIVTSGSSWKVQQATATQSTEKIAAVKPRYWIGEF